MPAWRRNLHLIRGSIPYTEETFLSVIESLHDEREWQRHSDEAYAQAAELAWDRVLEPLDAALHDPAYRYSTPHMQAVLSAPDRATA